MSEWDRTEENDKEEEREMKRKSEIDWERKVEREGERQGKRVYETSLQIHRLSYLRTLVKSYIIGKLNNLGLVAWSFNGYHSYLVAIIRYDKNGSFHKFLFFWIRPNWQVVKDPKILWWTLQSKKTSIEGKANFNYLGCLCVFLKKVTLLFPKGGAVAEWSKALL